MPLLDIFDPAGSLLENLSMPSIAVDLSSVVLNPTGASVDMTDEAELEAALGTLSRTATKRTLSHRLAK